MANTNDNFIPPNVRRLILLTVPSVPHLEAMLLLRDESAVRWDAKRLARRLYMAEDRVALILNGLAQNGIVLRSEGDTAEYTYQPATDELRQAIDETGACYARNLIGITNLIHSRADSKAQQFANAFKLRKE